MEKPLVYIIVVNWNLKDVTLECLESLYNLNYSNFRVVVVDNSSQDGSPEVIAKRFPQVEQILNTTNTGSTAGYNTGFQHALEKRADFAFLINNDTVISPDALNHLVEECAPDGVGMTGPLIYYASAPDQIWSAGAMRSRLTLDLIGNQGRGENFISAIDRDFLTSCALLVKREVLLHVGMMDEDFFVYQEELDYCYRVTKAGYRLRLVPKAKVWHKVSLSSGGSESPGERYWMAKNGILYYRKNAQWWQWLFIIPWRFGSAAKTTFRLLRLQKWNALSGYWRGLWDGIRATL